MAKVKIQGNASGSAVYTVQTSAGSVDKTITLPDATGTLLMTDGDGSSLSGLSHTPEGTAVLSTGETGATKFLREDGDGTCSWQAGGATGLDDVSGVARATSGLLFNSDTAAANTLDDYEEGTWTPSLDNAQTGSATIGTLHAATYTKIGNKVHLYCSMTVTSSASPATGGFRFTGFPFGFAAASENGFLILIYYNYKEPTMSFLNTSGYGYYTKETVGGNNLGGINEILDSSSVIGINFTYTTT